MAEERSTGRTPLPARPPGVPGTRCGARAVPLLRGSRRTDMGNAPICQACHSEKGLRTQGNIQDLDRTPDYYGYNSEESKEPEALVSLAEENRNHREKFKTGLGMLHLQRMALLTTLLDSLQY